MSNKFKVKNLTPKTNPLGWSTVKFILMVLSAILLTVTLVLWRADNQRIERLRMDILDSI